MAAQEKQDTECPSAFQLGYAKTIELLQQMQFYIMSNQIAMSP